MRNHIIIASLLSFVSVTGCSSAEEVVAPDAPAVTTVPRSPAGAFAVITTLDLQPPAPAQQVIDALDRAAANPSLFILERMIATFPDGPTKTIAEIAVPYVAAALDVKLAMIAPKFQPGIRALAGGFARIASHVELLEGWRIEPTGQTVRTLAGARFDVGPAPVIEFATHGMADVTATVRVGLDETGQLAVPKHAVSVRYGAVVRAGLDEAVVPGAVPGARDVAQALSMLVDCTGLGALVADKVGVGSALLYRGACVAAMNAVADELDEHVQGIDATPLILELAGAATGIDADHDGTMDVIKAGRWAGTVTATFAGAELP